MSIAHLPDSTARRIHACHQYPTAASVLDAVLHEARALEARLTSMARAASSDQNNNNNNNNKNINSDSSSPQQLSHEYAVYVCLEEHALGVSVQCMYHSPDGSGAFLSSMNNTANHNNNNHNNNNNKGTCKALQSECDAVFHGGGYDWDSTLAVIASLCGTLRVATEVRQYTSEVDEEDRYSQQQQQRSYRRPAQWDDRSNLWSHSKTNAAAAVVTAARADKTWIHGMLTEDGGDERKAQGGHQQQQQHIIQLPSFDQRGNSPSVWCAWDITISVCDLFDALPVRRQLFGASAALPCKRTGQVAGGGGGGGGGGSTTRAQQEEVQRVLSVAQQHAVETVLAPLYEKDVFFINCSDTTTATSSDSDNNKNKNKTASAAVSSSSSPSSTPQAWSRFSVYRHYRPLWMRGGTRYSTSSSPSSSSSSAAAAAIIASLTDSCSEVWWSVSNRGGGGSHVKSGVIAEELLLRVPHPHLFSAGCFSALTTTSSRSSNSNSNSSIIRRVVVRATRDSSDGYMVLFVDPVVVRLCKMKESSSTGASSAAASSSRRRRHWLTCIKPLIVSYFTLPAGSNSSSKLHKSHHNQSARLYGTVRHEHRLYEVFSRSPAVYPLLVVCHPRYITGADDGTALGNSKNHHQWRAAGEFEEMYRRAVQQLHDGRITQSSTNCIHDSNEMAAPQRSSAASASGFQLCLQQKFSSSRKEEEGAFTAMKNTTSTTTVPDAPHRTVAIPLYCKGKKLITRSKGNSQPSLSLQSVMQNLLRATTAQTAVVDDPNATNASSARRRKHHVGNMNVMAIVHAQRKAGIVAPTARRTPVLDPSRRALAFESCGIASEDTTRTRLVLHSVRDSVVCAAEALREVPRAFDAPRVWRPQGEGSNSNSQGRDDDDVRRLLTQTASTALQWQSKFILVMPPSPPQAPQQQNAVNIMGCGDCNSEEEEVFQQALMQRHRRRRRAPSSRVTSSSSFSSWFMLDQHAIHERIRLEFLCTFVEAFVVHPELPPMERNISQETEWCDGGNNSNKAGTTRRMKRRKLCPDALVARIAQHRAFLLEDHHNHHYHHHQEGRQHDTRYGVEDKEGAYNCGAGGAECGVQLCIPEDTVPLVTRCEAALRRWGWRFRHGGADGRSCVSIQQGGAVLEVEGFQLALRTVMQLRRMAEELDAVGCGDSSSSSFSRMMCPQSPSASVSTSPSASDSGANAAMTIIPSEVLDFLISRSCRGAVMFGDSLCAAQCQQLVGDLSLVDQFYVCSHGRASIARLTPLTS